MLATKFVDGAADNTLKIMIDTQFDGAYRFPNVIKAYEKCTKSLRRQEMSRQRPEDPAKEVFKSSQELMLEAMKHNAQMVFQVGEMLEMSMAKQPERPRAYQPIIGAAGA